MKRDVIRRLISSQSASVAPTVALSLFGLIAAGGIAFDYARLATMDSELQNAADQAALAAASQLTGDAGACSRAAAAAANMLNNYTLMANDSLGGAVVVPNEGTCDAIGQIRFYQDIGKTIPATTDAEAEFVEVQVNPRTAIYALTPVVAAFSSGPIRAIAFSTLGEAYCKVPPVMICNPQETATNLTFDPDGLNGRGLRLVSVGGGSGSWAPGDFGYLDMAGLSSGAPGLREGLGWGTPPTECIQETGLDTKPGATVTVTDAINTRFDLYTNVSCPSPGSCPASINTVKDVRRPANATGGNSCTMHPSQGWNLPEGYYGDTLPTTVAALPTTDTPTAMGLPRDICHSVDKTVAGACVTTNASGQLDYNPIGNGTWDRDAYFRTNYRRADGTYWTGTQWPDVNHTGLGSSATRYQVYLWEIANRGTVIDGVTILGPQPGGATGGTNVAHGEPVCSPLRGYGSGVVPPGSPDRRLITVAVVNCKQQSVNGNSTDIETTAWLDAFLVEPSVQRERTNAGDVYVEIVGSTTTGVQMVSKKVPYLIE